MKKTKELKTKNKLYVYVVMQRIVGVLMMLLYIIQIATLIMFLITFIFWLLNITDDYWGEYLKKMKKCLNVV